MATPLDYVDYYELLEVSPNASMATIERVFRYMAKRLHPDSSETGDVRKFSKLVDAYQVLTDPEKRAAFDIAYENQRQEKSALVQETGHLNSDSADRHRLLSLFYAQRRRDMKKPGIGVSTLEQVMGLPVEVLDFHVWYFREKGWIMREESGLLSITSEGVDKIESTLSSQREDRLKRITEEKSRVEFTSRPKAPTHAAAAAV